MDKAMFNSIYKTIIRPHLEYAVQSWCPYLRKDIHLLEQVQRRATAIVPELQNLPYEDWLKSLGLTTLEDTRLRGDLIEVYKMLNGLNNIDYSQFFTLHHVDQGAVTIGATSGIWLYLKSELREEDNSSVFVLLGIGMIYQQEL